jgi:DNA-binding transcriptional ArsR family regulator
MRTPPASPRESVTEAVAERIARRLDVLGQEVRIRLIYALHHRGELSVGELAGLVGVSVYDASQHLSVLRGEGIVRRIRDRQFVRYRLDDPTAVAIYEQVRTRIREQIDQAHREFSDDQTDVAF